MTASRSPVFNVHFPLGRLVIEKLEKTYHFFVSRDLPLITSRLFRLINYRFFASAGEAIDQPKTRIRRSATF